jgi:hypothetical protein
VVVKGSNLATYRIMPTIWGAQSVILSLACSVICLRKLILN